MEKTRKAKEESDRNCKQALGNTVTLGNARRSTLTKVHLSKSPIYIKKNSLLYIMFINAQRMNEAIGGKKI